MTLHRREFLAQSTAAVASAALASQTAWAEKPENGMNLPIVDTHQHLWDLTKFQPPWLDGAPEVLKKSYTTREYLAATKGLNLAQAVYMEVDVDPRQQTAEAEHVIALSKSDEHPTSGAVISGRPGSAEFQKYFAPFVKNPLIKGVRQVLHVPSAPAGLCLEKQYVANVAWLGEVGKSFDLCMRPRELQDGAKLAQACPGTRFIVDHCGNADPKAFGAKSKSGQDEEPWHDADAWRRDMESLAKCDNVICKISGIVVRAPKDNWDAQTLAPIVNHCLDTFGPDRVVFGGDWPVCLIVAPYRDWVTALREIVAERPLADQKKLWQDNAVRLYNLPRS